jgi:hypothetical protein
VSRAERDEYFLHQSKRKKEKFIAGKHFITNKKKSMLQSVTVKAPGYDQKDCFKKL